MNPIVIFSVCLVLTTFSACSARPSESPTPGKYTVSKSIKDDGKYRPVQRNEGRYIHMVEPYIHVSDNRELGKYVHIPNPYDGGYGPYSGLNNPYRHDESGNYDKYTTTSTTTRRPTTTTTTTIKPRLFNYYEEGGWKILRQEEEKEKHKYDFLYHTENGIYGEEKAHLHPGAGTAASGYYEYTGDDGELYRVNYKSDHRGFVPEGDHIPTPPPVPDAIKRALEYVAKKKETHGEVQSGRYDHKPDTIRRQNMPTIDRPLNQQQQPRALPPLPALGRPLNQQQPIQQQPRPFPPLPTLAPLPTIAPKRPDDQLIQQTQLAQQSQPDKLPQVQVPLPQVPIQKPVQLEPLKPVTLVQVPQVSAPVQLPQKIEVTPAKDQDVKVIAPAPLAQIEPKPRVEEELPQSDQPQSDQPQADQPQADQPQADQPQVDQIKKSEQDQLPVIKQEQPIEELKTEQSVESIVVVKPDNIERVAEIEPEPVITETSPEASEQDNTFEPPYQVIDQLTDEDSFELTIA